MMKRALGLTLLVALAGAPVALEAQTPGQRPDRPAHAPAFGMLLGHRAELGLTAEQVTRLEAIAQRLREQNAPLVEQLRASGHFQDRAGARQGERMRNMTPEQRAEMRERMQAMTPEQRRAMRDQMRAQMQQRRAEGDSMRVRQRREVPEALRPTVEQIRQNARAAHQEAMAVLTPEQQSRLGELRQERRREMGERGNRPRGAVRR